jgi:hypothetical protein
VLDFHDGRSEKNDYAGNRRGDCGSCRSREHRMGCGVAVRFGSALDCVGLQPKQTEAFVGRLPYGNYVVKALAKLDLILSGRS